MRICRIVGVLFLWISIFGFHSCQDDAANAGSSILEQDDEIRVKADTFGVISTLDSCAAISLTPDSFLLGECETHFGIIKADILTQLACPEGYVYPGGETAIVDSIYLYLHYKNWYGDANTPLGITVHEIDRETLLENAKYDSNLDLSDYCSLEDSTDLIATSSVIVPAVHTDSSYSMEMDAYVPTVCIKLSDEFAKRFFKIKEFPSQQAFNKQFKGLYISTDFGGSNVLYINDISMTVFYHFNMQDSVIYDTKSFYVNEEVRQVNRYIYPNRKNIIDYYSQVADTNYIVSPANIYTQLSMRMDSIFNRIENQLGDPSTYRVYVNKANLTVEVLYSDSMTSRPRDNWDTPAANMMLIRTDKLESFFAKNELPSDSTAIISALSTYTNSDEKTAHCYTYDLSKLLTAQLRQQEKIDELKFTLVPVSITTNSATGDITSVKQLQTISATCIRSANNTIDPMDIEVVYAGFNK